MVSVTKDRLGLGTGGVFTELSVGTVPVRLPNNLVGRTIVELYNKSSTQVFLVQNSSKTTGGRPLKQNCPMIIECSHTFAADDGGSADAVSLYLRTDSGTADVVVTEMF